MAKAFEKDCRPHGLFGWHMRSLRLSLNEVDVLRGDERLHRCLPLKSAAVPGIESCGVCASAFELHSSCMPRIQIIIRSLLRNPGLTLSAILALALGIGQTRLCSPSSARWRYILTTAEANRLIAILEREPTMPGHASRQPIT